MAGFGSNYGNLPWGGASEESGAVDVQETLTSTVQVSAQVTSAVQVTGSNSLTEGFTATGTVKVLGALAQSLTRVRVRFDLQIDPLYGPTLDPANYAIPGLSVLSVSLDISGTAVLLTTSTQSAGTYQVTVTAMRALAGDLLSSTANQASFYGFSVSPYFFAAVQSRTKLAVQFSAQPLDVGPLTNPTTYSVRTLTGVVIPVTSVEVAGPIPHSRVTLHLGASLEPLGYYEVGVGPQLETTTGRTYFPDTYVTQWGEASTPILGPGPMKLPFEVFSGEVQGGLLGNPAGQVFFSPALDVASSGSEIEVEAVSCCTQAYDSYHMPPGVPQAGLPLSTWGGLPTTVSGGNILGNRTWAPRDQSGDAHFAVGSQYQDTKAVPVSGHAEAVLTEVLDPTRGSRTNGLWTTWDVGALNPFIIADNLTPIGPGTTQTIVLQA